MRLFFTFLCALSVMVMPMMAQDIDESFLFINEEYEIIENGATITKNNVVLDDDGREVIYSGISVLDNGSSTTDYIKMIYTISKIDNGTYQLCFPTTCNLKTEIGTYETSPGQLMEGLQDIQSEWFPEGDGECVVTLSIEIMNKTPGFPPTYTHRADGPTITLRFVKGNPVPEPIKGDVNNDGEVNISDVNTVINVILAGILDNHAADVNQDGEINISDINALVDIILNQSN